MRRAFSTRLRWPTSCRGAVCAPARSGRARCALCRPPPWSGILPDPTWSGRDSGRSSFPGWWGLAGAAPGDSGFARRLHRPHVHAVDLRSGNVERQAALGEIGLRRGAQYRGAHGIAVVLDDVDHGELPQLRHVEALVDLALVGGAVAEISERDAVVAAIFVGKGKPVAERHLGGDDAMPAVKILVQREHVHGAALALGIAAAA